MDELDLDEEHKGDVKFEAGKLIHPLGMIGALMPYSTCFCHRDFTVDGVKNIIATLSNTSSSKTYKLFNDKNCPLSEDEKTYERLTEELNKTCQRYDISTCIRKVHFLAQIYLEGAELQTTVEFASGLDYDPQGKRKLEAIRNQNTLVGGGPRYKGRGLMQLT